MEKGQDLLMTNSSHSHGISDQMIVDTADSLLATRKMIYEKKSRILMILFIHEVVQICLNKRNKLDKEKSLCIFSGI